MTPPAMLSPIPIASAADLAKIGHEPNYPLNGSYIQTVDIDASGLTRSIGDLSGHPFTGCYDGGDYRIENMRICLFRRLDYQAELRNIQIVNSAIARNVYESYGAFGVLAGYIRRSTVKNIQVRNCSILASEIHSYTGSIAGHIETSTVNNVTIESVNVTTTGEFSSAGLIAGMAAEQIGLIDGVNAQNVRISTLGEKSFAGGVIGEMIGEMSRSGNIKHISLKNAVISTAGNSANAGGLFGMMQWVFSDINQKVVENATISQSQVITAGRDALAGMASGFFAGNMNDLVVNDCAVTTSGARAHAGIISGKGYGHINHLRLTNSTVVTHGEGANAETLTGETLILINANDCRATNVSASQNVPVLAPVTTPPVTTPPTTAPPATPPPATPPRIVPPSPTITIPAVAATAGSINLLSSSVAVGVIGGLSVGLVAGLLMALGVHCYQQLSKSRQTKKSPARADNPRAEREALLAKSGKRNERNR